MVVLCCSPPVYGRCVSLCSWDVSEDDTVCTRAASWPPEAREIQPSALPAKSTKKAALDPQTKEPSSMCHWPASEYLGSSHTQMPHQETGPTPQHSGSKTPHPRLAGLAKEPMAGSCLCHHMSLDITQAPPTSAHLLPTWLSCLYSDLCVLVSVSI